MPTLVDFFASHSELRGAVEFVRKLGGDKDPAVPVLEAALKDSRVTAAAFAEGVEHSEFGEASTPE